MESILYNYLFLEMKRSLQPQGAWKDEVTWNSNEFRPIL